MRPAPIRRSLRSVRRSGSGEGSATAVCDGRPSLAGWGRSVGGARSSGGNPGGETLARSRIASAAKIGLSTKKVRGDWLIVLAPSGFRRLSRDRRQGGDFSETAALEV